MLTLKTDRRKERSEACASARMIPRSRCSRPASLVARNATDNAAILPRTGSPESATCSVRECPRWVPLTPPRRVGSSVTVNPRTPSAQVRGDGGCPPAVTPAPFVKGPPGPCHVACGGGSPVPGEETYEPMAPAEMTFAEVVEAGGTAWHESNGYRYRFDADDGSVWFAGPVDCPGIFAWRLSDPERRAPACGWRHAPDCSCGHCNRMQSAVSSNPRVAESTDGAEPGAEAVSGPITLCKRLMASGERRSLRRPCEPHSQAVTQFGSKRARHHLRQSAGVFCGRSVESAIRQRQKRQRKGIMTILEAQCLTRPAYCFLPNCAPRRSWPLDERVSLVASPQLPSDWREAPHYGGLVPDEGWRHSAGFMWAVCAYEWDRASLLRPRGRAMSCYSLAALREQAQCCRRLEERLKLSPYHGASGDVASAICVAWPASADGLPLLALHGEAPMACAREVDGCGLRADSAQRHGRSEIT